MCCTVSRAVHFQAALPHREVDWLDGLSINNNSLLLLCLDLCFWQFFGWMGDITVGMQS